MCLLAAPPPPVLGWPPPMLGCCGRAPLLPPLGPHHRHNARSHLHLGSAAPPSGRRSSSQRGPVPRSSGSGSETEQDPSPWAEACRQDEGLWVLGQTRRSTDTAHSPLSRFKVISIFPSCVLTETLKDPRNQNVQTNRLSHRTLNVTRFRSSPLFWGGTEKLATTWLRTENGQLLIPPAFQGPQGWLPWGGSWNPARRDRQGLSLWPVVRALPIPVGAKPASPRSARIPGCPIFAPPGPPGNAWGAALPQLRRSWKS